MLYMDLELRVWRMCRALPIGPVVVPFGGSYLEISKVIPKRNYYGAYG